MRDIRGLTLVEVLVTSLLLALVVAGLLPLLSSGQTTWEHVRRSTGMVQNTRLALDRLVREMRAAQSFGVITPTLIRFTQYSGQATLTPPWWNSSYFCRRRITVSTGTAAAPSGYSISFTFDHASYVTAGKAQSDGDDVRVVYWNGSSWVDLDRHLDDISSWNSASTQIWFRTQAAIAASSTDTNYYLYYCNSAATSPPANAMNVFLFHDTFPGSSIDAGKWSVTSGTVSISGGILTVNTSSAVFAQPAYAFGTDTRWEGRATRSSSPTDHYYWTAAEDTSFAATFIRFRESGGTDTVANKLSSTTTTTYSPSTQSSWHTYAFAREGTARIRFYQDSTNVVTHTSNIPSTNLRIYLQNTSTSVTLRVEWARVRRYVVPEPTASLGSEESNSPTVTIEYQLNTTTNELEYRWVDTAFQPFAGPFRSMSVTCFDANGASINCNPAGSVRSVQVSLVAMDPSGIAPDITLTIRAFRQVP